MKNRWLLCNKHRPNAELNLFCFPYAGGGTTSFQALVPYLPPKWNMYTVIYPGRNHRIGDPTITDANELCLELIAQLQPYLQKPFLFFGHSMGALVAHELAVALHERALPTPRQLFASGAPAPQLGLRDEEFLGLTEEQLVPAVQSKYNSIPAQVLNHPELLELIRVPLIADFTLIGNYRYIDDKPPLSVPLSVFGGLQDWVTREELLAWRERTIGRFSLHLFQGEHFFIHSQPQLVMQTLAEDYSLGQPLP
jgi:medium-chain acyl-[acyl-carrier-protein] hydrolase